ncbi:hypothetical protein ACOMHN_066464 [Nucella lapillus]
MASLARLEWNAERILEKAMTSFQLTLTNDLMPSFHKELSRLLTTEEQQHKLQQLVQTFLEDHRVKLFGLNLGSLVFILEHCSVDDARTALESPQRQTELQDVLLEFLPKWVSSSAVWSVSSYDLTVEDCAQNFGYKDFSTISIVASLGQVEKIDSGSARVPESSPEELAAADNDDRGAGLESEMLETYFGVEEDTGSLTPEDTEQSGDIESTADADSFQYVETPSMTQAENLLQETGTVILCGPPSSGKTTLAHVLLKRCRLQGFEPYTLQQLEGLKRGHSEPGRLGVVVLDGVLGVLRVSQRQYERWKKVEDIALMLMKKRECRLVVTMYPHVLRELRQLEKNRDSPLLDDSSVVHLTDDLPPQVKEELLNFHLNSLSLEPDKQQEVVRAVLENDASGPVFPGCCAHMVKHWESSEDPSTVFSAPAEVHAQLFKQMVRHHSHGAFFAAVLALVMRNRSPSLQLWSETAQHLRELGFKQLSGHGLAQCEDVLQGSILSGEAFSSRVLYEAACLALGRFFRLSTLLKVCDLPFLVQHVGVLTEDQERSEGLSSPIRVTVGSVPSCSLNPKQCAEDCRSLVERIYSEILLGDLRQVAQQPCLQCPQFLQELDAFYALDSKRIVNMMRAVDPVNKLPLAYWSAFHSCHHLTQWCLTKMKENDALSVRILMACSLLDCVSQSSAHKLQIFHPGMVTPKHFKFPGRTMDFPLLAKDQILTKDTQKRIETVAESESAQGRLLYLSDPSLPISPDIVTVQMTNEKLQLTVKDNRHWYLVFRLLTDREAGETDQDGNSLLHIAVSSGHSPAVRLALKSGAVITQQNGQGVSVYQLAHQLHSTQSKEMVENADQIFKYIPDLDKEDVQLLLLKEITVQDRNSSGRTGLLVACRQGRGDIADLYIELGAEVNIEDPLPYRAKGVDETGVDIHSGCTPLHYACHKGLVYTVQQLIQREADVDAGTKNGARALHFVGLCPTHSASASITQHLLWAGADVNAQDHEGRTALLYAACNGHSDTAEQLIQHGADVNAQNEWGDTPLFCAVRNGHTDTSQVLIRHGADVNVHYEWGDTPLLCAVWHDLSDTAELLIRHGADVNAQNEDGSSPLLHAAREGRSRIAEVLIHHGADINILNKESDTPLLRTAKAGHVDVAKVLIRHGANVNAQNEDGNSPLLLAARKRCSDLVELLMLHGADVNSRNKHGTSSLLHAARKGHADILALLIHHGADVNTRTGDGDSPLLSAAREGHADVAELLIQHGADISAQNKNNGDTPLISASREGHADIVQLLICHKADVTAAKKDGNSPLLLASSRGRSDLAELLIRQGADVNARNKDGNTPLLIAAREGHMDTVGLLICHGANVNSQDSDGNSPILHAVRKRYSAIVQLLITHGADVNKQNRDGTSPLLCAAQVGHSDIAARLLSHQAHVNAHNKYGETPLISAARKDRSDIVELLLRHGADVQNDYGDTPLMCAAREGYVTTAELLIHHGADINAKTADSNTPLLYATVGGHPEMAELLIQHGADVNTQDEESNTLLLNASREGFTDIVDILIRHGADVNTINDKGNSSLMCAVLEGHSDIAELLIRSGAEIKTNKMDTLLHLLHLMPSMSFQKQVKR